MSGQFVLLWSDALVWTLLALLVLVGFFVSRSEPLLGSWRRVGANPVGMSALTVLLVFVLIGLLDSVHYRPRLAGQPAEKAVYGVEVLSVLDSLLSGLRARNEKTYSEPFATRLYTKESRESPSGGITREYPRLKHSGAHLVDESQVTPDIAWTALRGLGLAAILWGALAALVALRQARVLGVAFREGARAVLHGQTQYAWRAMLVTVGVVLSVAVPLALLAGSYHVFGTDKIGQDVLYQVLKSVRTALVIGLLTTLVTLPLAVVLGIAAGYFRGWVDDVIQYLYTVLNSIPGVLLIAAAVLMMQVVIDTHPQWFATAAERADVRLLALCLILGVTSWTGLCRLLRGESLKLRELEYIQAARAFGVSDARIIGRHLLPNVMHIVIIALVMDFSGLVLAEAVLSYVGIGVDPTMISFGTMINNARLELGREPAVWWSLAAAFVFMFVLVLAANLFADVVRDAFDPRVA